MHQPVYQLNYDSDYLMPWVRLHTAKHYLPLILEAEKFPNLKQNFNIVPTLTDSIIDFSGNALDIHSALTIKDVKDMTPDDKEFILNNFFDAEYTSMIEPYERFKELFNKRFSENCGIDDFSLQDYADLTALFNLVWIDDSLYKRFPEVLKLLEKGRDYTLKERKRIIDIYRKIAKLFVPACKKFLRDRKAELMISPFYHPILPIMTNIKEAQENLDTVDSTLSDLDMSDDARLQIEAAIKRSEKVFGRKFQGSWMPEMGVSENVLKLLSDFNIKWTIADEGTLSAAMNYNFIRDFDGNLEDPYHLMKPYVSKTTGVNIIFRDSMLSSLINNEYPNYSPEDAARDLYEKIKVIQSKLTTSPDDKHLLTIALDGENCWNNYSYNGREFLDKIYELIENDYSLETVLISEYLEEEKHKKEIDAIKSSSWANRNFQLWIGEPVKNLAWTYLKNVKKDMDNILLSNKKGMNVELARKELFLCEGSDWFWWYGEPNDSGQDHIFDYLFREHLKSIYKYLGEDYPRYLDLPLISTIQPTESSVDFPITPAMTGEFEDTEWESANCVSVPDGPILQGQKLFDKICYCADYDKFYLRLYLSDCIEEDSVNPVLQQMYIYMKNPDRIQTQSPVRLINKTENVSPVMKEKFHNELRVSMTEKKLYPIRFTKAIQDGLWAIQNSERIEIIYKDVIDIAIPFEDLDVRRGDTLEFFFANTNFGIKDAFSPQDIMLSIKRPQ